MIGTSSFKKSIRITEGKRECSKEELAAYTRLSEAVPIRRCYVNCCKGINSWVSL